ncbi:MAG: DUF4920 domain-containing protein [Acidobacteria bacterium]|nr:DUF4920 domain-containing protein [Acidobacteriota bacterium]
MKLLIATLVPALLCCAAEIKLGKPLQVKETTPIAAINADPAAFVGKTVQVKGKVVELCQKMGCWMNLADPSGGKPVRIKVKDGEIVFPKTAAGKLALAEGVVAKLELTKEQAIAQARHEAEENGRKFDPASVAAGVTIYQINGTGAVILE